MNEFKRIARAKRVQFVWPSSIFPELLKKPFNMYIIKWDSPILIWQSSKHSNRKLMQQTQLKILGIKWALRRFWFLSFSCNNPPTFPKLKFFLVACSQTTCHRTKKMWFNSLVEEDNGTCYAPFNSSRLIRSSCLIRAGIVAAFLLFKVRPI